VSEQCPGQRPQRVFGIDFSGAADAGNRIWIAEGTIENDRLRIAVCRRARDLPESATTRDPCLGALRSFIEAQGPAVVGLDFPFSLPAALVEPDDWEAFVRSFGQRYATPKAFRQSCRQAAGGAESKRLTDRESQTPFSPYNLRLFRQTYHGIRDLLAPLVRSAAVCVLPMQPALSDRPWLLEICPASTLKHNGLYAPYKGRSAKHTQARVRILESIEHGYGLYFPDVAVRDLVVDNPGGDALDSVIAACAVARTLHRPDLLRETSKPPYDVEGHVYV